MRVSLQGLNTLWCYCQYLPFLGFSRPVMETAYRNLAVCTYPIWGLGPTVGLDSWGEGFLIFLKIYLPL